MTFRWFRAALTTVVFAIASSSMCFGQAARPIGYGYGIRLSDDRQLVPNEDQTWEVVGGGRPSLMMWWRTVRDRSDEQAPHRVAAEESRTEFAAKNVLLERVESFPLADQSGNQYAWEAVFSAPGRPGHLHHLSRVLGPKILVMIVMADDSDVTTIQEARAVALLVEKLPRPSPSSRSLVYEDKLFRFSYPETWTQVQTAEGVALINSWAACPVMVSWKPAASMNPQTAHHEALQKWRSETVGNLWRMVSEGEVNGNNSGGFETTLRASSAAWTGFTRYFTTFVISGRLLTITSCSDVGTSEDGRFVARTLIAAPLPLEGTWYASGPDYLYFYPNGQFKKGPSEKASRRGTWHAEGDAIVVVWDDSERVTWRYAMQGAQLVLDGKVYYRQR